MLRDLVIALSLSNLCFISAWRWLLLPSELTIYHQKAPRPLVDYFALILDVLVLAALFFISIVLARRTRIKFVMKTAKVAFILLLLSLPLYGLLTQLDNPSLRQFALPVIGDESVVRRLFFTLPLSFCLFALLMAFFRLDRAVRIAVSLVLILTPLLLVNISQVVVTATRDRSFEHELRSSPVQRKSKQGRVRALWLVFDELDFRTAFENRPQNLKLPELDRLAAESLFAKSAYPPAGETFLTMPALITGRLVSDARRKGPDELMIKFGDDTEFAPWSAQPNIFSRVREAGFNTALIGWYHPYCRILGENLTKCGYQDGLALVDDQGVTPYMYQHALRAALTPPFASLVLAQRINVADRVRRTKITDFDSMYKQAIDLAKDPDVAVVMVHWPIPHHPNIYDRANDEISSAPGHSYLDNLALVDRTLGDIRRAMETSGTWDNTAVLVTSDHWWRSRSLWRKYRTWTPEDEATASFVVDQRVPFILKLPGAGEATAFSPAFNTVLTHDLLLAILSGEVSDTQGAATWLDRHRSIGRSPYDERSSRNIH